MDYLGKDIKKLGFGLMRLPMIGEKIDIEQVKDMVDLFMANGFTYFDTAYGYGNGASEEAAKTALVDRYPRESFQLATKLPPWSGAKTEDEAREMFWTSLKRTGAGYFDFYLLHNIGSNRIQIFEDYNLWEFGLELKEKGLIKHFGFSFHDKSDVLDELLTKHPEAEFVQLQINYADWDSETIESRKCYEVARKHNKPVIIMEPVKGGTLANLPDKLARIFKEADENASLASWAIRYAASLDGIITVLSGMSNMEQMQDNISYMKGFKPLNEKEREVIAKVQTAMKELASIPCTDCKYCVEGCPQGINIPSLFELMNDYYVYENLEGAKKSYKWQTEKRGRASDCIACGNCEGVCPQSIPIINELSKIAEVMEAGV
jgi:predicted aldo/keto reductase-like oxidoreductase